MIVIRVETSTRDVGVLRLTGRVSVRQSFSFLVCDLKTGEVQVMVAEGSEVRGPSDGGVTDGAKERTEEGE